MSLLLVSSFPTMNKTQK